MAGPGRDKITEWLESEGYSVEALDEIPDEVVWALVAAEPDSTRSTVVIREERFYQIQRTTTISPGHAEALAQVENSPYDKFLLDLSRDVVLAGARLVLHRGEEEGEDVKRIGGFTVFERTPEDRVSRESFATALDTVATATLLAVFQVRRAAGEGPS